MNFFFLQNLLVADNTLGLNALDQGIIDLCRHGGKDTGRVDNTVQNQLGSDTAGHADQASHGGGALGVAVLEHGGGAGLAGTVLELDLELVLEHDHVALALGVHHLVLEGGAKGVEVVAAAVDGCLGEHAQPLHALDDALDLVALDRRLFLDDLNEVTIV